MQIERDLRLRAESEVAAMQFESQEERAMMMAALNQQAEQFREAFAQLQEHSACAQRNERVHAEERQRAVQAWEKSEKDNEKLEQHGKPKRESRLPKFVQNLGKKTKLAVASTAVAASLLATSALYETIPDTFPGVKGYIEQGYEYITDSSN